MCSGWPQGRFKAFKKYYFNRIGKKHRKPVKSTDNLITISLQLILFNRSYSLKYYRLVYTIRFQKCRDSKLCFVASICRSLLLLFILTCTKGSQNIEVVQYKLRLSLERYMEQSGLSKPTVIIHFWTNICTMYIKDRRIPTQSSKKF